MDASNVTALPGRGVPEQPDASAGEQRVSSPLPVPAAAEIPHRHPHGGVPPVPSVIRNVSGNNAGGTLNALPSAAANLAFSEGMALFEPPASADIPQAPSAAPEQMLLYDAIPQEQENIPSLADGIKAFLGAGAVLPVPPAYSRPDDASVFADDDADAESAVRAKLPLLTDGIKSLPALAAEAVNKQSEALKSPASADMAGMIREAAETFREWHKELNERADIPHAPEDVLSAVRGDSIPLRTSADAESAPRGDEIVTRNAEQSLTDVLFNTIPGLDAQYEMRSDSADEPSIAAVRAESEESAQPAGTFSDADAAAEQSVQDEKPVYVIPPSLNNASAAVPAPQPAEIRPDAHIPYAQPERIEHQRPIYDIQPPINDAGDAEQSVQDEKPVYVIPPSLNNASAAVPQPSEVRPDANIPYAQPERIEPQRPIDDIQPPIDDAGAAEQPVQDEKPVYVIPPSLNNVPAAEAAPQPAEISSDTADTVQKPAAVSVLSMVGAMIGKIGGGTKQPARTDEAPADSAPQPAGEASSPKPSSPSLTDVLNTMRDANKRPDDAPAHSAQQPVNESPARIPSVADGLETMHRDNKLPESTDYSEPEPSVLPPEELTSIAMPPAPEEYDGASQQDTSAPADGSAAQTEGVLPPMPDARDVSALLPQGMGIDVLRQGMIVPLRIDDGVLIVGARSVDAWPRAQMLGTALGYPAEIEIRSEDEINGLLHTLLDLRSVAADEVAKGIEGIDDIDDLTREDVLSDSVDVPVIRLVNGLFVDALRQRATDIHVEPYEEEVLIRFRIDGVLQDRLRLPRSHQAPLTSRIKVMSRMDIAEHMAPQDGRIGITLGGRAVDVRVGLVPTQYGERLAMRLLDKGHGLLTLEDLGMEQSERETMEGLIHRPHGMILFTGPTGSGKSTSLYAILQALARPEVNIITVEDPVEYALPGASQIQVNEKAGVTFASALRSILRQDPDIVMIGEMRDFETAHIGVQASLTGHLVLSTLHTNDSIGAIIRLVDMGIEPYLAANCMIGTVAQRLARRLCPHCRRKIAPPQLMAKQGVTEAYEPAGCPECHNTGYKGRIGLYEQFVVNEEIQEAFVEGASASKLRDIARKNGFRTLWEIGLSAVQAGKTSPDELVRVAGED